MNRMNQDLSVKTSDSVYRIVLRDDFTDLIKEIQTLQHNYSSYVVITDSNVAPYYLEPIMNQLQFFKKPVHHIIFNAGEKQKNLDTISLFYQQMLEYQCDRRTLVVALGGGVTGDMAGFCAATYMRGVDFIQIPTSLLAQVDSSVGGKTGVDFNQHKNIVGAFYAPKLVYINTSTLETLPKREYYAGLAEVIKYGVIKDKALFHYLVQEKESILALEDEQLKTIILRSCELKQDIVEDDEHEKGVRAILNFGHTLGHSIEGLKGFEWVHGECVAVGMIGEAILSNSLGYLSDEELKALTLLIKNYHLPTFVTEIESNQVYSNLFFDKKTQGNMLVFGLLRGIGHCELNDGPIDEALIRQSIDIIIDGQEIL